MFPDSVSFCQAKWSSFGQLVIVYPMLGILLVKFWTISHSLPHAGHFVGQSLAPFWSWVVDPQPEHGLGSLFGVPFSFRYEDYL